MKFLLKLNLWHRFSVLLVLFSLTFLVSGTWSFKTFDEFKVGGADYQAITQATHSVIDIRSPSLHIVESYLICLQLADTPDNAQRVKLIGRLAVMKRKFDASYREWIKQAANNKLNDNLLSQTTAPAFLLFASAFDELIPALQAGDRAAVLVTVKHMTEQYQAHLHAIDHALQVTRQFQKTAEAQVKERIQWASLLLLSILLLSLGTGLKIAAMIRDSITYPLNEVIRIANRIASGDFSARVEQHGQHEFASLGQAMNQMAESLARSNAALKSHAAALEHQATHDDLTGLANRALLEDRLQQAILYAHRYQRNIVVLFLDLDNFKLINDSMGHMMGDVLLKHVADRMVQCVRSSDTVARLGGDEFVILLLDQGDNTDAILRVVQKIRETVAEPLHIGGHNLEVTCSIGLARYPTDGDCIEDLLRNADAAMYRAKEMGRNDFQFYTAEMNAEIHEKLALQEGLRVATARNEFTLLYQPQMDIRSGRIIGVEALLRWPRGKGEVVAPLKFIPLAEESGLIVPIGEWVLRTACRQNKAWQDSGMPPVAIAVNVSARQFREETLVSQVENALRETGLSPEYLELELTESIIMQDVPQAVGKMKALREIGVQFAIDDFGTGYSSLSALKSFPVSRLKIDRSFVLDIPNSRDDEEIAMAVIALGHKLRLKVVAEGVETKEQLEFLRVHGCDELQGYYVSEPLTADQFKTFMELEGRESKEERAPGHLLQTGV